MSIYDKAYDVIVLGGGPAGVAAAAAASTNGADVLLIERYGFLGGMLTSASLPVFSLFSDGEKPIIRGIGLDILKKMEAQSWKNPFIEKGNGLHGLDWVAVDPEVLKRVLDQTVLESGCKILFHTNAIQVNTDEDCIRTVLIYNKEGIRAVSSRYFIDCTGDADIVSMAGGEIEYGDGNGQVQGVTLCFRVTNVDGTKFLEYKKEVGETGNLTHAVARAKENGDFPFDETQVATFALQDSNTAGLNFGHVFGINPLKAEDLTKAEIEGRETIPAMLKFLRKYVPGLGNAVLTLSGPVIGIRESRRIVGEYRLTVQDYYNRQNFDDNIARCSYPIDIHPASPCDKINTKLEYDYKVSKYKPGESYGIPYRSLVPVRLKNIIAAGRTISTDRAVNGSCRVTPACFATGQAAGTAAALCSRDGRDFRSVDIDALQKLLTAQNAYL